MMVRGSIIGAALLSVFILPWQAALVLLVGAAVVFPPAGILIGITAELFYWSAGLFPYYAVGGIVASGIGLLVHRFIKTRIMDA